MKKSSIVLLVLVVLVFSVHSSVAGDMPNSVAFCSENEGKFEINFKNQIFQVSGTDEHVTKFLQEVGKEHNIKYFATEEGTGFFKFAADNKAMGKVDKKFISFPLEEKWTLFSFRPAPPPNLRVKGLTLK